MNARIDTLAAANTLWRRNLRDSFDAMCVMRNDINDVVTLPSLESDLLQGPETSVFCAEVAFAVVGKITAQQARIDKLERALRDIKLYTEEDYALGRACAALKEDE